MVMNKDNTALIIVDMQEDFAREQFNPEDIKTISNAYDEFFSNENIQGMNVYNFSSKAFGNTLPEVKKTLSGLDNVKYMTKKPTVDSCFTQKKLLESLVDDGIDNLIVTGISGPYCVRGTAQMGEMKGYNIVSSLDMVAAQKDRKSEMNEFVDWFYTKGDMYDSVDELLGDFE